MVSPLHNLILYHIVGVVIVVVVTVVDDDTISIPRFPPIHPTMTSQVFSREKYPKQGWTLVSPLRDLIL